mmetsp:Transcript_12971/g.35579  ORF Transcript_12971/g.35579 Transcript_12971/m.35579 type:complete len:203 (-) Transcript_12971:1632-2240(-)
MLWNRPRAQCKDRFCCKAFGLWSAAWRAASWTSGGSCLRVPVGRLLLLTNRWIDLAELLRSLVISFSMALPPCSLRAASRILASSTASFTEIIKALWSRMAGCLASFRLFIRNSSSKRRTWALAEEMTQLMPFFCHWTRRSSSMVSAVESILCTDSKESTTMESLTPSLCSLTKCLCSNSSWKNSALEKARGPRNSKMRIPG